MHLMLITPNGDVENLQDLSPTDLVESLHVLGEVFTGIPIAAAQVRFEGRVLNPKQTLAAEGLADGSMIEIRTAPPPNPASGATPPPIGAGQPLIGPNGQPMSEAETAAALAALLGGAQIPPPAAPAPIANTPEAIAAALAGALPSGNVPAAAPAQPAEEIDMMDPEIQAKLAAKIQRDNIEENRTAAYEHMPEAFGSVIMLYIDCEVNKKPMKAFVDSGAQMTIMSKSFAEQCDLLRLCDEGYSGTAKGVGSAKIIGRVHSTTMKIAGAYIQISVTILDQDGMDFLLGLDNLKRHQMCIDLKDSVLRMGDLSTPFLTEGELPKKYLGGPEVEDDPNATDDEKITKLVELGFEPDAVREALAQAKGSASAAADILTGAGSPTRPGGGPGF